MTPNAGLWTVSVTASFGIHLMLGVALAAAMAFQTKEPEDTTRISISTLAVRPAAETEIEAAAETAVDVAALPAEAVV